MCPSSPSRLFGPPAAILLAIIAGACAAPQPVTEVADLDIDLLPSPTRASLRGLCVVDERTVWASGSGGTVLRSVDSGETWDTITVPGAEALDLRDVAARDARRALVLVAGRPARIYRTTDGGRSFAIVHESAHDDAFFDAIDLWRSGGGLVFGDPTAGSFHVLHAADDDRWARLPAAWLPAPADGEAGFAASGACLVTGAGGRAWIGTGGAVARVLIARDRGLSWSAATTPLQSGAPSKGVFALAFDAAGETGVAVGGDHLDPGAGEGAAAYTRDGGRRWHAAEVGVGGYRSGVGHVGGDAFVAVGTNGIDLSDDGGRTWRRIAEDGFHAVEFAPSGLVGYAVGSEGRIVRLRPR